MLYCGLDVASKESYYFITDEKGKEVSKGFLPTDRDGLRTRLQEYIDQGMKIALETGNQTIWMYAYLCELGAEVEVVNASKVKLITHTKCKTDKVDAQQLCKLLRIDELPEPVHMASKVGLEVRGLLSSRRQLVRARVKLCNVVRGLVKQEGVNLASKRMQTYKCWDELLKRTWKHDHVHTVVKAYYASWCCLTESIKEVERALQEYHARDKRVELLETIPGVGKVASQTLVSAVDDIKRFGSSKKLVSYSGLAPRVRSSGERTEYGRISREGRGELRGIWCQVAHVVLRNKGEETRALRRWHEQIARRRGKRTAIVALTRKLLTIAYCMLRDHEVYNAKLLS